MEQKRCISSLTLEQLAAELKALGQPGFRAKQIFHWVHQKLVTEFSAMTDQPKTLLATLEEHFYIAAPQIERRQEAKDGTVKSRIVPTLTPGSIVTDPRSCVHYIVTEYGMVNLKGLSTWQRAEALIGIAHPDFREQLIADAEKMHIWRRSNK